MLYLLLGACVTTPTEPPESTAAVASSVAIPVAPWRVVVADGSNNVTRVESTGAAVGWVYEPMTPERSSSGVYSGGEPAAGTLDPAATEALWTAVSQALSDASGHAQARAMGTISLSVTIDGDTQAVVLTPAAGAELLDQCRSAREGRR